MNIMKEKVDVFLKKHKMHYEDINIYEGSSNFIEDMKKGLNNESSSLKMLCTYIGDEGEIPVGEPVIVMDAGGTNFRVAIVNFNSNKKPIIEEYKIHDMPGINGEISKEEFYKTVVNYLKPVIHRSNKIGFCFSYPTEILPNKDGRLIQFNKEVKVRDMVGEEIGKDLLKALKDMGYKEDKKIVLLNDTVATLLGGKAEYQDRDFDSNIGFILGTGTNTCYLEENKNIKKAKTLACQEGSTIINIESGGYEGACRGEIDEIFDKTTANPGSQKFEKMISGAYQGGLILEIIRKATAEGLFSAGFANRIKNISNLTSKEANDFIEYPYLSSNILGKYSNSTNESHRKEDKQTLYYIIDAVIERAAKLVAVNLAAVILKTKTGKNPCLPVCVTADGSTFYKSKFFKTKLEYYVKECLNEKMGIYCEFVKAEDVTLIGTAIAGLLN